MVPDSPDWSWPQWHSSDAEEPLRSLQQNIVHSMIDVLETKPTIEWNQPFSSRISIFARHLWQEMYSS